MQYDHTINGKRVTLKQRLPVRDGQRLPPLLHRSDETTAQVEILSLIIDTWEFPGDPHDPASFDELDMFEEFLPLVNIAGEHLTERMSRKTAKN